MARTVKTTKAFAVQRRGHGRLERLFTDTNAAETHCCELNRACRAWANPFGWSGSDPKGLCSAGSRAFRQSLKKLGIPPPKRGIRWEDWWDATRPTITAEQCEAVWDLLDNFQAFVVVEVPLED